MAGRSVTVKKRKGADGGPTHGIRYFKVGEGFVLSDMQAELDEYMEILLGRQDPPNDNGPMTLMEFAETVHARLGEIEMAIQRAENEGAVLKGTMLYRFRTGELRTAQEVFAKAIDLGSRRITYYLKSQDDGSVRP